MQFISKPIGRNKIAGQDDFRYIIIHHPKPEIPDQFVKDFPMGPIYQDNQLKVFRVADLLHH
jgi:hypothetical protein